MENLFYRLMMFLPLVLLSCSGTTATIFRNVPNHLALIVFKVKIAPDPLRVMNSWNNSTNFCNWTGVTCSDVHCRRVTFMELQSLKLGTIEKTVIKEAGATYTISGIIEETDETTLRVMELPLKQKGFTPIPKKTKNIEAVVAEATEEGEGNKENSNVVVGSVGVKASNYEYLLSMAIGSLTLEKEQDNSDVKAEVARKTLKGTVMNEAGMKDSKQVKTPRKTNTEKNNNISTTADAVEESVMVSAEELINFFWTFGCSFLCCHKVSLQLAVAAAVRILGTLTKGVKIIHPLQS
ncbi:hypothetical protein GIB67_020284 [Kingdonia uniflora]|uniref:Leucine-rich repeat-containing N-terminal plant-type domain-containing protein n=1 Tax=Kingdonia uniflora TaxID=39325 RepID=A0A7J7P4A4_9MAGN|nr:hypothetical protein GIB67_020284 [Kingdonia uniflora]